LIVSSLCRADVFVLAASSIVTRCSPRPDTGVTVTQLAEGVIFHEHSGRADTMNVARAPPAANGCAGIDADTSQDTIDGLDEPTKEESHAAASVHASAVSTRAKARPGGRTARTAGGPVIVPAGAPAGSHGDLGN
jgi:hypothetical protein